MIKVMAFGTFDILHPGHLFYLAQAKKLGNKLIVIVARDNTVKRVKIRPPEHNENERLKKVQAQEYVDEAVLGDENHL